jgi:hypothetical protein
MEVLGPITIISILLGVSLLFASIAIKVKRIKQLRERADLLGMPEPIDQEELDWSKITEIFGWIFIIFGFLLALLSFL